MEVLNSTTFAHICPQTKDLPPFLAKKLESAIVTAALKSQKNTKQALEEKIARAQKKRDEKKSEKAARIMQHHEKVNEKKLKKIQKLIDTNELQQQILTTKMQIAELKAKEQIQKQMLKAQEMGTVKVNMARENREAMQAVELSKRSYKEDVCKDKPTAIRFEFVGKLKERNYNILKNANRQRFQSVIDRTKKAQTLQEKMDKAEARRQSIIQKKVETAQKFATLVNYNSDKQDKLKDKMAKAEERRQLILQEKIEIAKKSASLPNFDKIKKDNIQEKQAKAEERRQQILTQKIIKAKDSYIHGPSADERQAIKLSNQKKLYGNAIRFNEVKKPVAWTIRDRSTSGSNSDEKSVFIQSDLSRNVYLLKNKPHVKNIVSTANSVAFEIDRNHVKRAQTARKPSVEKQMIGAKIFNSLKDEGWEMV